MLFRSFGGAIRGAEREILMSANVHWASVRGAPTSKAIVTGAMLGLAFGVAAAEKASDRFRRLAAPVPLAIPLGQTTEVRFESSDLGPSPRL